MTHQWNDVPGLWLAQYNAGSAAGRSKQISSTPPRRPLASTRSGQGAMPYSLNSSTKVVR